MPFTTQHACELNAGVRSHWGESIRHVPMLARAHPLAHPRIPEGALFTSKFLWSPIRPANLSCVPCFPVPFVRVPGIQWLECPAVPAIQLSACRDRCFTSPPQWPCTANLGSMRASGGTWRPYPRRCGDQADLPMMVEQSLRSTQSQCILKALPRHYPMCCNDANMIIHWGVRPRLSTAPS